MVPPPPDVPALPDPDASPSTGSLLWRVAGLAVTAISLYLLFPSLVQVFSSWDQLDDVSPWWFAVIVAAEAASFGCVWVLQRLALRTTRWFAIGTSQLAGNAFSRIVPGGAATGLALQMRMLTDAGVKTTTAASGLTAVSLLTTAVVLALPVFSLPAILGGTPVADSLESAAFVGAGVFVVMVVAGLALLFSDGLLRNVGRAVQGVGNVARRRRGEAPVTDLPQRLTAERDLIRATLQEKWWVAVLAAVGRSLFDYLALLAALTAVGADPDPSLVLLAYVAATVLAMIPITPGGLGFVEAGLTATLALAGVPAPAAVVATLAYRLASYWLPLPAGLVAAAMFRHRYRGRPAVTVLSSPDPSP